MKRKFITLRRIIRAGGINFVRNAWLSIAAMAVMVITLSIVLVSVIANATFTHTVQQLTDRIDISVYLKDTITVKQKDDLLNKIKHVENVKELTYISKDQALQTYKKQNQGNLDLLLAISQTDNPLPATIQIKPKDPNKIQDIKNVLERADIKSLQSDPTSYSGDRKEAIDKITKATSFMRRAGVFGVIIFAFISMLIIFNTIQMAIFNRRDELTIMRLLGANTIFIRGPFVIESIIYGVISAVVSVSLCNALFVVFSSAFNASSLGLLDINYANEYFAQHFWLILLTQLSIGIFIGAASSTLATRRYLKFKTTK
ncbi:MAG: Cell division protein FtsX [Candidatus Saccharibacteria bacterium]|nr:Cell division protein FtsX [Candidatus Saccharibacteria bacterium]